MYDEAADDLTELFSASGLSSQLLSISLFTPQSVALDLRDSHTIHYPRKMSASQSKGRFEPKELVNLDPPKSDPITVDHLSKCNGENQPLFCAAEV